MMPKIPADGIVYFAPYGAATILDEDGGARIVIPPPVLIEPQGDWRREYPHTHQVYPHDWSIAFGYGDLDGEFSTEQPYVIVQYDGLYGTHWHPLTIEDVSSLMAHLGAILQREAVRGDESG